MKYARRVTVLCWAGCLLLAAVVILSPSFVANASPTILGRIIVLDRLLVSVFPAASALNEGGLLYDATAKTVRYSDGVAWLPISTVPTAFASTDTVPLLYQGTAAQGTRPAQVTFEGATYHTAVPAQFSQIVFRATTFSGAPTIRVLVYQAPAGGAGVASLKASVTAFPIASANTTFTVTVPEGAVRLEPGRFYVLWGRDSAAGSATMRTYGMQQYDMLNNEVPSGLFATVFSTTIPANTSPGTFDPAVGTGAATPITTDSGLVLRLRVP